ncbi:OXA-60 family carbapenem-hydrolyzing class D beta-lactamase [Ralstonia sp. UBA689]|uniref:OXA-60 family carbapenem-hydrolyzing class D beta-lactamase n=1 Tax=Ralstonia sp. UBA689 TaxID=1947373 RepID=UPI0025FCB795|nr:OXA-60 family carbapenem-hydrolyzing class D beta-lactamase [Ralstonia sp. UBA689]
MFPRWSKTFALAMTACAFAMGVTTARAELVVRDDLKRMFDEAGVSGTFVLMDISADRTYVVDPARAARRINPASTFKIPNSLIAFDTGAVRDDHEVLPYGGKPQPYKQWEHDMALPEAIRVSNVPVYQEVARRVGHERMQAYVDAFDYGNRQIGSVIDQFWLRGPLEISAFEEARFTSRMALKQLPVKPRTWNMVHRMLLIEQKGDASLYAKTGLATEYQPEIGWWVGWVERAGHVYAFALNIDMPREGDMAKRIALGKQLMSALGVWPAP